MHSWLPLRTVDLARLSRLRVPVDAFLFFRDLFIGDRFDFAVLNADRQRFRIVRDRPISSAELIRHLEGEIVCATGAAPVDRSIVGESLGTGHMTRWFVVDLDADAMGHHGAGTLFTRYDAVCAIFGVPHLLHRSSDSGGLHLRYFLKHWTRLEDLRDPRGRGGTLNQLLHGHGLHEKPGSVEFYPRGKYQQSLGNRLRLPFGVGSRLLDPYDHSPLSPGTLSDLLYTWNQFAGVELPTLDLSELTGEITPHSPSKTARPKRAMAATSWQVSVDKVRVEGLSAEGQFNNVIGVLAWEEARLGNDPDLARENLRRWLTKNHHGCSRTFNASPDRAYREIDEIVSRVYQRCKPTAVRRPPLNGVDIARIVSATWDDACIVDAKTGDVYPRLKLQRYLTQIFTAAKQAILTRARGMLADPNSSVHQDGLGSIEALRAAIAALQCEPGVFEVALPYNLRVTFDGSSPTAQLALWRLALRTGLIRRVRAHNTWKRKAARYAIPLDFGSGESIGLEEYLYRIPTDELRKKYSPHYVRAIRTASLKTVLDRPSVATEGGNPVDPSAFADGGMRPPSVFNEIPPWDAPPPPCPRHPPSRLRHDHQRVKQPPLTTS